MNAPRFSRKESFQSSGVSSSSKESGFQSKEIGGGGKEFFGGNPNTRMPRRNRLFALAGPIIILICCLVGACAAVIYMLSQGILQLPGA